MNANYINNLKNNSDFLVTDKLSENLLVVRDDLYPQLGGGNKGRKMNSIGQFLLKKNHNAIVTNGAIQSNHCRATALFAARYNLECTLVLHGDKDAFLSQSGNAKIIRDANVKIIFCEPKYISTEMDKAMQHYNNNGLNPYYLSGGGHTLEGGKAYIDAIETYINKETFKPDYIFLASGTGSTHSGIMAGLDKFKLNTKVIGISVARNKKRAEDIVSKLYRDLCSTYHIETLNRETIVVDKHLCGGYKKFNNEILNISKKSIANYGFILDTTYTAKAFYGMKKYIEEHNIKGNIIFWHTGGILNYLV